MDHIQDNIHTDENGKRWLTNDKGEVLTDRGEKVPVMQSQIVTAEGEFTLYDTSQGHCAMCGRLTCHGQCFK